MKKTSKKLLLSLCTLLLTIGTTFAQSPKNFSIIPERANPGQDIEIVYDAKGTVLDNKKKISAVVYAYRNYKWYASDLSLSTSGNNSWKAPYKVPADCGIIALKFLSDTLTDNNSDQGYFTMFLDKEKPGVMAKGAYAGWGLARSPKYGMDIPGYIKFEGVSDSATYHWLNQEISFHQSAKSILVYPYALATKATFKTEATPRLQRVLAYLKRADASEADLLNARRILIRIMQNKTTADSVDQVMLQRFPKGNLARLNAFKAMPAGSDMNVLLQANRKFVAEFPQQGINDEFAIENRLNYPIIYQNIIVLGAYANKNYADFDTYINQLAFSSLPTLYYKIVEIPFSRKEVAENLLLGVSEKLIKRIESLQGIRPDEYAYLSQKGWSSFVNESVAKRILPIHVHLLNTAGRYKEALVYANQSKSFLGYSSATLNAELANTLSHLGDKAALKLLLEKSVFENQSSTEMLSMLKETYIKGKGSEKGYEAYLNSLKNQANGLKMKEEIKKEIFSKPMVDFAMQDLNGNTIKLQDLKGKTIVFDFWATWCVPCKASFPGMKLAVEKYAKDPNVVFYFVDTEERSADYKAEVAKYMQDNSYNFNVLFDNKSPGAKATGEVFERICKAFTISGIPQKIIVDANGNARFITVGFKGSATELSDEIATMVEITKTVK